MTEATTSSRRHIEFITGKLAAASLRRVVQPLADRVGFEFTITVMPITVAALMTPSWIAKRFEAADQATEIMLPGHCGPDLRPLIEKTSLPITLGPRDLNALPDFFGRPRETHESWGKHSIEILAEINHAPRLSAANLVQQAIQLRQAGADVIDVGCQPGEFWAGVGPCVRQLKEEGLRVSIDSFDPREVAAAVNAGAELVLSVNASNREAATDWGCEVVAIPDDPQTLAGLDETVNLLDKHSVPFRLDPILEPIGFGFAESLRRYHHVRERYPDAAMMMGIGNVTELTDVDSVGVNTLLLAICQEWKIGSVLTTQVINWARSCVKECDLARRLVHFAVENSVLPKRVDEQLVILRDPKLFPQGDETLQQLADAIRDPNFRIFAEDDKLHLMTRDLYLKHTDPFALFDAAMQCESTKIDASHAFYLGYELCKAVTALTLGKQYRQDQALDWGFLTRPERHR